MSTNSDNREKDDFYPTPPYAVQALLENIQLPHKIWEPACGDGAISKELEAAGHEVISTDLVDRGYGQANIDFLMEIKCPAQYIITNPPYKLANQFVTKCFDLLHAHEELFGFAMLLRLAWLEGDERRRTIFDVHPPAEVMVFSKRLTMIRGDHDSAWYGSGKIAFAWMLWDREPGETRLKWL